MLLAGARERCSRVVLTWKYGGLSAYVAGDVVASWAARVPMVRCRSPLGCKGDTAHGGWIAPAYHGNERVVGVSVQAEHGRDMVQEGRWGAREARKARWVDGSTARSVLSMGMQAQPERGIVREGPWGERVTW